MTTPPIRVLIVNDSRTVRASLRRTLSPAEGFQVVAELESASSIVEVVRRVAPDVVLMDLVMPGMDGWQATRELMAHRPVPIVLVSQAVNPRDTNVALEAIRAGALAIAEPPPGTATHAHRRDAFLALVRSAAEVRPRAAEGLAPGNVQPRRARRAASLIAIVASTGGPAAMMSILEALPPGEFAPIVLVQHLAHGFVDGLARWFGTTGHPVIVAEEGTYPQRGHVYLSPDDRHIGVRTDGLLRISGEPPRGQFRPSGTHLLETMARALGRRGAAVILTGMGDDGALGARALHGAGGDVIAQDERSSVVFGMPGAAIALGAVDEVLPLGDIPRWIVEKSVVR